MRSAVGRRAGVVVPIEGCLVPTGSSTLHANACFLPSPASYRQDSAPGTAAVPPDACLPARTFLYTGPSEHFDGPAQGHLSHLLIPPRQICTIVPGGVSAANCSEQ